MKKEKLGIQYAFCIDGLVQSVSLFLLALSVLTDFFFQAAPSPKAQRGPNLSLRLAHLAIAIMPDRPTRISFTHPSGYKSLLPAGTVLKPSYNVPETLELSPKTGLQGSHRSETERQ
jgi:hypothetical protein